jgi:hypothetical protein
VFDCASLSTVIGKKMEAFACEEAAVMMLLERVSEAQRIAAMVRQTKEAMMSRVHRAVLFSVPRSY